MTMSPEFDYGRLKSFGDDVFISARAEIRRPHLVSVGSHVAIDSGFYCTVGATIGDYVHIGPYVTAIGGAEGRLQVGNFVTIAAGARLICVSDEHLGEGLMGYGVPERFRDRMRRSPIRVESFASVGTNAVVFPGVTVAEGSVVGSCALLLRSTEPWTVYAGVPAKPLKARRRDRMVEFARELGYAR